MTNHDDSNLVAPRDACPTCGERNTDKLVWVDDEIVRCGMCGTEYDPLRKYRGGNDEHTT